MAYPPAVIDRALTMACGVEASVEFRAACNATARRMMTAALQNQQAGTEYASWSDCSSGPHHHRGRATLHDEGSAAQ